MMTLWERIAAINAHDGPPAATSGSLHGAGNALDYPALLALARQRRERHPQLQGRSVALACSDLLDFCVGLLAFDGWCSDLWLAAPALAQEEHERHRRQLGCRFVWRDGSLEDVFPDEDQPVGAPDPEVAATRWWLSTSGTSGTPKLIAHTLASLTARIRISPFSRSLHWGLVYQPTRFAGLQVVLQALLSGATLVDAQGPEPDQRLDAMLMHQVDALSATPSLWRALLMTGRLNHLKLRQMTLGGEIADQGLLDWLRGYFPEAKLLHIYASTEAGVGFTVADGKAGFPAVWIDAPDGVAPLPMRIDEQGHLRVRPAIAAQAGLVTARTDTDGYLDTEDLVRRVGERVLFLGRAGGVINVGGNKVHPEQVEQVILSVPGILQARVYGKSSSMVGQLVCADVVAAAPEQQARLQVAVMKQCLQQLERYQIPVKLNWVASISAGDAGKMIRH